MAQVQLHTLDIVSGDISKKWVDLTTARYTALTNALPTSLSGNTQVVIPDTIGGKQYRVLETPYQIDAIHQLQKAISPQGQSALVEAVLEMYDGTSNLSLAFAALGADQAAAAPLVAYFTNVATATTASADGVRLPAATNLAVYVVKNPQAFVIDVFPATGEFVGNGAVNVAYSIPAGATVSFVTRSNGGTTKRWFPLT